MRCLTIVAISILTSVVSLTEGSRILIAAPTGTKSHQNVYIPIAKELVRRGHQVTIITNYLNDELTNIENIQQIWLEKLVIDPALFPNPFSKPTSLFEKLTTFVKIAEAIYYYPANVTETTYGDERVQQIMTEHFDLVIISEACSSTCFPFGWHFKAPTISFSPNVMFPGRATMLGDDEHHSYVPFLLSTFTDRMSLTERTANYLLSELFYAVSHSLHLNTVHSIFRRLVNPNCPPLIELEKNFSLVFVNSHPVFNYPRVLPPQAIEVAGLHCRSAKPLPEDLNKFVSESDAGFIMFGVGSVLRMEEVPEEIIQSIMKAFSRLPQRVIWQWKGKVRSDLPKNVLAMSWLPQQDLLGHKNCKAFLTHGGLNSLQEAVYHAVPILGFPSGSDQTINIDRAVKEGYAVKLNWKELTEETLFASINLLLHDSSYKNSAVRMSNLFRDQMQTPLERAVYWTEFVMRHNGTNHLRLGSVDLAPYQRALIDVYVVLILSALIPLLFTFFCIRKCCCRRQSVSVNKKHQ